MEATNQTSETQGETGAETPQAIGTPEVAAPEVGPEAGEVVKPKRVRRAPVVVVVPQIEHLEAKIEAILMSSDRAVPARRIAPAVGLVRQLDNADELEDLPEVPVEIAQAISTAIETLNTAYQSTGRSFRIEHVAGGYRILTTAEFAEVVHAFRKSGVTGKLSRAAIETLAIIAYRQPVTRAELEAIRGVSCGEVLRSLLERRLITIKGRAEELGRPLLYGSTKQFLDHFGLSSLKDLPTVDDFKAGG